MHVIECAKQFRHIFRGHLFAKNLILHACDLVEQLSSADVLHDEVDIFLVDVSLIILHDIGVVQIGENVDLLHDGLELIVQLLLVENLDGDLVITIVLVVSQENFAKRS